MAVVTVLVPLPKYYNPDTTGARRSIEPEKFNMTAEEIAQRFGGGVMWLFPEGSGPSGYWWSRGILSTDVLAMLEVDVPDTEDARSWLKTYAENVLTERFEQEAIYLKFYGGGTGVQTITVTREPPRGI